MNKQQQQQQYCEYTSLATGTCPFVVGFSAGSLFSSFSRIPAFSFFFFFSLAKMDDSRSGNGGISSRTVAFNEDMTRNHNHNIRWFEFKISSFLGTGEEGSFQGKKNWTYQNIWRGNCAKLQVLQCPLLDLCIWIFKVWVTSQNLKWSNRRENISLQLKVSSASSIWALSSSKIYHIKMSDLC